MAYLLPFLQDFSFPTSIAIGALSLFFLFFSVLVRRPFDGRKMGSAVPAVLPTVPEVPGLPIIGNLLQLKEKKPHRTFLEWAEEYGPIYSIKTGASTIIVLNSPDVAKEAMVTRFSSISTRKLSNALKILTCDKTMVAMSDYDEFHKTVKRHILNNLLGPNAQKRHRSHRDAMMDNMLEQLHVLAKGDPAKAVNFRHIFESALFRLSLKQVLGADVESVYVEELGSLLSRKEIHKILVLDMMEGAIDVDWRDFFPYLKWVPNKKFENNIRQKHLRRLAVMNALIKQQRKRIDSGEGVNCYLDYMLSEAQNLSNEQIAILVWEAIIETADTTLVTTEWAMYQLAKDPIRQDRLYREIQDVCGSNKMTEEQFYRLPYLNAVFHETIRKHSPAPLVPLRYVHEDTQIGGYHVPAGSEIAVNIWGCNMNKNDWQNPEEWSPERFLEGKYEPQDLHKTMAFGAGKRVCAGALQAMLVACSSIGRFVQEFEWRLVGSEEENVDTLGLTSQKLYPLHVAIKLRN